MILVDTSVWIEHFRYGEQRLAKHLAEGLVLMHPWIAGELACGNLKNRQSVLSDLRALPSARLASDEDVLSMIEGRRLWGRGLAWIDIHLLVSCLLSSCPLWTFDKRLDLAARHLGIASS